VRECETQPVFAGLGEDRGKGIGAEVLELVDEKVEVAALGFRPVRPGHRRQLKLRHEQRPKQVGLVVAETPLGEVGDEQAPVVHHERETQLASDLAQDVSHHWIQQELTELVLDRGNGLAFEPLVVAGVFLRPEGADERVFDLADDSFPEPVLSEQPVDGQERHVLAIEQTSDRVVQEVFKPRPPRITPDGFERPDYPGGHLVALVSGHVRQKIQGDGKLDIAGIEVAEVVRAPRRDVVEDLLGQVAVGINQPDAVPKGNVLNDQVAQKRRFPRTRLADDVHVLPGVCAGDANRLGVAPAVSCCKSDRRFSIHGARTSRHPGHGQNPPCRLDSVRGHAGNCVWNKRAR
jgi:hypothetical protein